MNLSDRCRLSPAFSDALKNTRHALLAEDPERSLIRALTQFHDAARAETLRDAEEICDEAGAVYTSKALNEQADGAYALMERFRRKADEAEQTPAVVFPPTERAAVLLDAAAECNKAGGAYAERGANDAAGAAFALMETFLRKAGEAEFAATPCSVPNVCLDGDDPCDAHERILGHIEGDHDLCVPDCGQEWLRRLAVEAHDTGTQQQAVALSTPCANCPHGRNWHDKGSGECLMAAPLMATCDCPAFTAPVAQQPAAEVCRPVEVDGETVLVRGASEMTEQERGYFAEIVRAAKRKYAAEHGAEQQAAAADGEETPA